VIPARFTELLSARAYLSGQAPGTGFSNNIEEHYGATPLISKFLR
jgi:hypothetical protein